MHQKLLLYSAHRNIIEYYAAGSEGDRKRGGGGHLLTKQIGLDLLFSYSRASLMDALLSFFIIIQDCTK